MTAAGETALPTFSATIPKNSKFRAAACETRSQDSFKPRFDCNVTYIAGPPITFWVSHRRGGHFLPQPFDALESAQSSTNQLPWLRRSD